MKTSTPKTTESKSSATTNIALLQLPMLSPQDVRLEKYLHECTKQKVQIVALGEYVLSPFYRELEAPSFRAMIGSYLNECLQQLTKLSTKFKLMLIVPLITEEKDRNGLAKPYKSIALINGKQTKLYHQQRLIAYPHWNEKKFFANKLPKSVSLPLIIEQNGLKIAVIAGFEAHFDEIWLKLKNAGVDAVIIPCSNTFGSNKRWQNLFCMRAFTNSMAILRVNRIGSVCYDEAKWEFYGDSLSINAHGEIEENLEEKEGMMVINLKSDEIHAAQKEWGFR